MNETILQNCVHGGSCAPLSVKFPASQFYCSRAKATENDVQHQGVVAGVDMALGSLLREKGTKWGFEGAAGKAVAAGQQSGGGWFAGVGVWRDRPSPARRRSNTAWKHQNDPSPNPCCQCATCQCASCPGCLFCRLLSCNAQTTGCIIGPSVIPMEVMHHMSLSYCTTQFTNVNVHIAR